MTTKPANSMLAELDAGRALAELVREMLASDVAVITPAEFRPRLLASLKAFDDVLRPPRPIAPEPPPS